MSCRVDKTGLDYVGNIIRPPSEAYSIIIQVTLGCSHNKCTFCGTYAGRRFNIKDEETILEDIGFAARYMTRQDRVFICDGDALILPQKKLVWLLETIREKLPWVRRVGLYANAKSIAMKSDDQLAQLKELGLGIVYMGVESGDDRVLEDINKGSTSAKLIEQGRRVMAAGIKLSVTVLIGVAGVEGSLEHARATGKLLTEMDPDYVGALTLMLIPGTPLGDAARAGRFSLPDAAEMLAELREMLAATSLSRGMFFANHASNYVPIKVRFPGQAKDQALALLDQALQGRVGLKPEWARAL